MKKIVWLPLLAGVTLTSIAFAAADPRPDLAGRVTRNDGAPVPKATVFIYTAGPKTGTASTCPSCYPDCRKKAQTDAQGRFRIESLSPKLLFRLLIVANGHEAQFVTKVDPAAGPADVALKPMDEAILKSKSRIAGVVLDPEGNALVGAVVGPEGVERGNGTQWGGTDDYVDPVAVSDDHGRFWLRCQDGVKTVHATVEGRGVAKRWVTLKPGRDHLVRLQEGVTVSGRIVRDGRPLKDVIVGLVTTERTCGVCLHDFEAITDADGHFLLLNVTPENQYYLFTKMESLGDNGALPVKTIKAGDTGSMLKLGELPVRAGHRVAGRVVLSDGKPVPPDTRLLLGREEAWDHTEVVLDPRGSFEFLGVPDESVSLSVRIKGYAFSKGNPSLDWPNGSIVGRIEKDMENLTLLMDPGDRRFYRDDEIPSDVERQPGNKPLRGVKR
jgi:hypothetical protein